MSATTQSHVDTLQAQVEQDGTITNAQKAQVASHCYSIATILFGTNAASTVNVNASSGKPNGHGG